MAIGMPVTTCLASGLALLPVLLFVLMESPCLRIRRVVHVDGESNLSVVHVVYAVRTKIVLNESRSWTNQVF